MPSPFPGMDPYFEHPEIWPGVHHRLIVAIADFLSVRLRPKYSVSLEVRMYETSDDRSLLVGIPDVAAIAKKGCSISTPAASQATVAASPTAPVTVTLPMPITIRQGYLEVKEVATQEVVTALEVLSPANKRAGKGRNVYLTKRERILGSLTNFVEIDLLRSGEAMPILDAEISSHYRVLVSRGDRRPQADLYAFNLQDRIGCFPLPLRAEDSELAIDLRALLDRIYDVGGYDLKIDYRAEPVPQLSKKDAAWADTLLCQQGLR